MLAKDEEALICDFAETYHIYDMTQLPVSTAAILAAGLREDSRIMRKMSEQRVGINTQLLALLFDAVEGLTWMFADPKTRGKYPKSQYERIMGIAKNDDLQAFSSPEAFEAARQAIIQGGA